MGERHHKQNLKLISKSAYEKISTNSQYNKRKQNRNKTFVEIPKIQVSVMNVKMFKVSSMWPKSTS